MSELKNIVGARVKALRVNKGFSQDELAAAIDRSIHAVSQIERSINTPSLETAALLAKALGCSIDDFVFDRQKQGERKKSDKRRMAEDQLWAKLEGLSDKQLAAVSQSVTVIEGL